MCQKQCRDENGFKCHLTSDSHRRQMEVFGQNPERVIDGYSEEFHISFMEHMRIAYGSRHKSNLAMFFVVSPEIC
jgi:DNA/RNA-binding protein KIN17